MPHNDDLDRLAALAKRAADEPAWHQFSRYLEHRAGGLRRASMDAADAFVVAAKSWKYEQRETFVCWLAEEAAAMCDHRLLIPHGLLVGLVAPTIREWRSHEPASSVAYYLSGKYCRGDESDPLPLEAFRRSVSLDLDFQSPRRAFIDWVTGHAKYNQHELPWHGYLGDAKDDVRDLSEAQTMLAGVHDSRWRESLERELRDLLEAARAWCRTHDGPARTEK